MPPALRKQRSQQVRKILAASAHAYRRNFLGKTVHVLWETAQRNESQVWQMSGLSDNYLRVQAVSPQPLTNHLSEVRLTTLIGEKMSGTLLS